MVNWGKLELRHDTDYYLPRHYRLLERLNGSQHTIKKLYEVSRHIVDGPFGSAIKADDYVEIGVPFIRVADVTHGDGTLDTKDMIYISEEAHRGIKRSTAVPGDVVIAKTGATMGAASVVPPTIAEANIRGDLALVGKLGSWADADYLSAFINTRIGYNLFWRLNSGSTRGRVVISNLKKFPVIWPEAAIRERIVQLVEDGRRQKNKRLAEANALLASIDDYLLSELGIVLPPEPESTIANRMFRSNAHDLGGWRFDPFYHQPYFAQLMAALEKSPFPTVKLVTLVSSLAGGATPTRGNTELYCDDGVKFLRIMNVRPNRLVMKNMKHVQINVHDGELHRSQLEADDVLMTITGRVGTCAVVPPDILPANINQHIVRFRISKSIALPEYVSLFFNSKLGFALSNRGVTGGTRIALDYGTIRSLPIPLPDLDKQHRIVGEALRLQTEARDLKAEAKAELEKAKAEIEAILLGDAA